MRRLPLPEPTLIVVEHLAVNQSTVMRIGRPARSLDLNRESGASCARYRTNAVL